MIRVVLDTNVLVSANLSEEGLEALVVSLALNQKIQLHVSEPILQEYERVLRYPRLKFEAKEVARFLARLRRSSVLVMSTLTLSASPDEADNRFLECAEAARADFLVTGNKKHFPKRWKTTEVVNTRELLGRIGSSFLE
jgi:putative PIN family toxin of toxin-antitoxin system